MNPQDLFAIEVDVSIPSGGGSATIWTPADGVSSIKAFRILLTVSLPDPEGREDIRFYSADTALPGVWFLWDRQAFSLGMEQRRWLETSPGEPLRIWASGAAEIKGVLTVEVV